jgi:hypothetical protein
VISSQKEQEEEAEDQGHNGVQVEDSGHSSYFFLAAVFEKCEGTGNGTTEKIGMMPPRRGCVQIPS